MKSVCLALVANPGNVGQIQNQQITKGRQKGEYFNNQSESSFENKRTQKKIFFFLPFFRFFYLDSDSLKEYLSDELFI